MSEGSYDTEDCKDWYKFCFVITGIYNSLEYIQAENSYFTL